MKPDVRRLQFANGWEKACYIDGCARLEQNQRAVREAARPLATITDPLERARALQRWIRDRVRYVGDPGGREELADCATILGRMHDDCDGKARLFVAMALALGYEARIRPVFRGEEFKHVQAEVRWPGSIAIPLAGPDGWIPVELILEGVELGSGLEAARHDAAGAPITR